MENILIIGFYDEAKLYSGNVSWKGNYYRDILTSSDFKNTELTKIKRAVGYFARNTDSGLKAFEIEINNITADEKQLKLDYNVICENEIKSYSVKSAVIRILREKENGINNFPFCLISEEEIFNSFLEDDAISKKIKTLNSNNDWKGIYSLFSPIENIKDKKHIWNNEYLLNSLSFACAKLSECYINLKFHFKDDKQRNEFISNQKKFREETMMLRKRCIELNPGNAGYFSNLGYTHYQSVRELMFPGGRRDGKILDEAEKCIEYIDRALAIDPNRISDLYRKGQILSSVIPSVSLFRMKKENKNEIAIKINDSFKKATECFMKAEDVYELIPLIEEKELIRYFKEYIKSLYNCAGAYSSMVMNDWDYTGYFIKLSKDISGNGIEIKNENSDKAIYYMEKCIIKDSGLKDSKLKMSDALYAAKKDGKICGVYKLYSMGKYYFRKYLLLSGYGKNETSQSNEARVYAEKFLITAMSFPWTIELRNQSKAFIAERLARVYLTKSEYEKAIVTLKPFIGNRTDYYIRYTFATALYKSGKYQEAGEQIRISLTDANRNKEIYLGKFILSCIEIKNGNLENAGVKMKEAILEARKSGKKNLFSLYVTEAFIEYKTGNMQGAEDFMKLACESNPYNLKIRKRLNKWKSDKTNFDLITI